MSLLDVNELRELEGRRVSLALVDGSTIEDALLVSAGRGRARTLWLFGQGDDMFVPTDGVWDAWEPRTGASRTAVA